MISTLQKNMGRKMVMLLSTLAIVLLIGLAFSSVRRILGHVPVPSGPQVIAGMDNICIDFVVVDPEYTTVALSTFTCNRHIKLDSYFTRECPRIKISNVEPKIVITEDKLCSAFGPCTESVADNDSCHWAEQELTIDQDGKFINR